MNIPRLIKSNARVVSKSTLSRLGGLGEITSPGIPEQRSMADMPNIFMSKIREVPTIKLSLTHCMLCSPTLNAAIVDPTPPLRPDLMDDPDMPVLAVISSDLLDDDDNDDNNNVFSMTTMRLQLMSTLSNAILLWSRSVFIKLWNWSEWKLSTLICLEEGRRTKMRWSLMLRVCSKNLVSACAILYNWCLSENFRCWLGFWECRGSR